MIAVSLDEAGLGPLEEHELMAPPIMRSEALSGLHEMAYRGEISAALADAARGRVVDFPVAVVSHEETMDRAWRIAEDLGWAKTYDAEYVALAQLLECSLVTIDAKLARGAGRLIRIFGPGELADL